eukprot:maker-scaffold178_size283195-snap-gene-0.11 protein:Tk10252 transcript:maker-scaffold178_size283195-snap-gene-0.11-mRNA-1 annotation:"---NA---"
MKTAQLQLTCVVAVAMIGAALGMPQAAQGPEVDQGYNTIIKHCQTQEEILVNQDSLDINGCLVGPCGERVCPQGAVGVAQDRTTFRGNKGPGQTGSNGNAGPIDSAGNPVDPAAVTYLKQIEAYKKWELQQLENNKKIIG